MPSLQSVLRSSSEVETYFCRSSDKISSGEESEHRAREPHWKPRPDLMRHTRKRDYPEEGENREEGNTERNEEECLVLLKPGVSVVSADHVF